MRCGHYHALRLRSDQYSSLDGMPNAVFKVYLGQELIPREKALFH